MRKPLVQVHWSVCVTKLQLFYTSETNMKIQYLRKLTYEVNRNVSSDVARSVVTKD